MLYGPVKALHARLYRWDGLFLVAEDVPDTPWYTTETLKLF